MSVPMIVSAIVKLVLDSAPGETPLSGNNAPALAVCAKSPNATLKAAASVPVRRIVGAAICKARGLYLLDHLATGRRSPGASGGFAQALR